MGVFTSIAEYKPHSFNVMAVFTLLNQESAITILHVLWISLVRLKFVVPVVTYMATCSFSCMTALPSYLSSLIAIFHLASAMCFILLQIGHGFLPLIRLQ